MYAVTVYLHRCNIKFYVMYIERYLNFVHQCNSKFNCIFKYMDKTPLYVFVNLDVYLRDKEHLV